LGHLSASLGFCEPHYKARLAFHRSNLRKETNSGGVKMPGHSLVAKNEPFKEMSANERLVDAIKPAAALMKGEVAITVLKVPNTASALARPSPLASAASSGGQHDRASPRSMRCRYAHGEWYLRAYSCAPQCRQVCGRNAYGGRPLCSLARRARGRHE